ncbi:hypothetical protein FHS17_006139 [Paenibacillus lupini]|nr:hypothetical protein [Paenibacillus lupini]
MVFDLLKLCFIAFSVISNGAVLLVVQFSKNNFFQQRCVSYHVIEFSVNPYFSLISISIYQ